MLQLFLFKMAGKQSKQVICLKRSAIQPITQALCPAPDHQEILIGLWLASLASNPTSDKWKGPIPI